MSEELEEEEELEVAVFSLFSLISISISAGSIFFLFFPPSVEEKTDVLFNRLLINGAVLASTTVML